MAGDLVYTTVLFGLFEVSKAWFPSLQSKHIRYEKATERGAK